MSIYLNGEELPEEIFGLTADGDPYYYISFKNGCPENCDEDTLVDLLEYGMQGFSVAFMVNLTQLTLDDWKSVLSELVEVWCEKDKILKNVLSVYSNRDPLYEKVYQKGQRETFASMFY